MTNKSLSSIGAALVVVGLGGTIWAQRTPNTSKPSQATDPKSQVDILDLNDYRVMAESRGVMIRVNAKDPKVQSMFQSQAELALRRNGVTVLTTDQMKEDIRWNFLLVNLLADEEANVYCLSTDYREPVTLLRKKRTLVVPVALYEDEKIGIYDPAELDDLKKVFEEQLDRFCLAWLKANPKR